MGFAAIATQHWEAWCYGGWVLAGLALGAHSEGNGFSPGEVVYSTHEYERRGEGVWNPKLCVPKIAQINISFCKFHFPPRYRGGSRVGGGGPGGGVFPCVGGGGGP